MHSAKKHITPIDMEIIYRAYRSVWTERTYENRITDYNVAQRAKRQGDPQAGGSCA